MTIRSSDVIPPSRYWLAVIAVMGFPLLSCLAGFLFGGGASRALLKIAPIEQYAAHKNASVRHRS